MSIIGGSGSEKTNSVFNLMNKKPDTGKMFLYTKDLYEAKCQLLVNKKTSTG